jgi:hypothetical protein
MVPVEGEGQSFPAFLKRGIGTSPKVMSLRYVDELAISLPELRRASCLIPYIIITIFSNFPA